ncbi:LCP family protein [Geodermatophilus ruber]|uniref:Transcriptional attenuator, LytR family n=1 Tax=Geodermatophilus ruber TaxID=504800 RepID=A0A1I4LN93_9ACTN|nr:LCP family protein [Geodermatophilus ruber]SFL92435.1 transcriptional attenuator, LytR family [Geodermatophilus ruber]
MSSERNENGAPGGRRPLPARLDPGAGRTPRRRSATPSPDPADRAPRSGDTGRRRGHGAAVAVRAVAALLALVVLGASGWGWYLGQVADASVNRTDAIPTDGNEGTGNGGAAMNLLLVGNDSRAALSPEQLGQLSAGEESGVNTDTMILVHVPADGSKASFVSFPRDSYVEIPGHGWDKLNAAYAAGYFGTPDGATDTQRQAAGAQLLIRTISGLTGLQIDHYAEVDLLGFFNLSNVVGGVEVNLCAPARDRYSGVDLPAGPQTVSGEQALAFVRQRHGLPRGDFDRIIRQQTFIAGMIRKMLSENVLLDLGKQRQLVEAAAGSLTVDQSLDLFGLASQMQSVTAGSIEFQTIPYVGDDEDEEGRYILRLQDEDTLHEFFAQLSAEPEEPDAPAAPATVAPSAVSVEVYNGSGIPGLAASAAAALETAGFAVSGTGNADSSDYTRTEIRYAAGDDALATTLAASIPGATAVESDDAASGTVQLVLGSDFNAVGQPTTPQAPAAPVEGEDARTAADTTCIN